MNDLAPAPPLTPEQAKVIESLGNGATIKRAAQDAGVTIHQVGKWRNLPVFSREFDAARCVRSMAMVDTLQDMKDPELWPDVQRAKLVADNIKWTVARENRKEYGDRLDVNVDVQVDIRGALEAARQRVKLLPACDPAQVEDAEYTDASNTCDDARNDNASIPALLPVDALPQPDIFS